jgi:hypothetical protein
VNRDPDERPQPDGAAPDEFDAIVSAWRREGPVPQWPDERDTEEPKSGLFDAADRPTQPAGDPDQPPAAAPSREPAPAEPLPPGTLDDEHFVPPEPPPLPRLGPPAMVGLALIGLGLALVTVPGWIVPEPYGLPLGLVGLASGLGWLVLRLWPDPPSRGGDDDGDDDGAVV